MDLAFTLVWMVYLAGFLGTVLRSKAPHTNIVSWLFLLFIVTAGMLHILNNLAVPASLLGSKSYTIYPGVQDAITQWWYGHWR